MLIKNKRDFLARGLRATGALDLLERWASRPGLLVLTYHRIGDPSATDFYAPVVSATPEGLREQLRRLRRTRRVLTLEEATEIIASGSPIHRSVALVTFDDGTRDNAEVAAPILREEGVPATFFLPTGLIDEPRLPWYDHVASVLNQSKVRILRLDRPEPMVVDLAQVSKAQAIARVVWACLAVDIDTNDEAGVLAHLEERAEATLDATATGRELFMSWDDARALIRAGHSVGSHAHSHRKLSALPEADQRDELTRSKAILETRLGREARTLAYPYGWPGAYDETTQRLAREAGYRVAFASIEGVNRPGAMDPFAIRRLNIGSTDSPVMVRARIALQSALGRSLV
ncbi:MAG: polysaccharide deacetylase family protein [Isosphaeraceae bacterium]